MKRIFTILCALALVMAGSATALAAEPAEGGQSASYYPISVEEYTYGDFDELRINKTYQLSLSDDPSLIPTEDSCVIIDQIRKTQKKLGFSGLVPSFLTERGQ